LNLDVSSPKAFRALLLCCVACLVLPAPPLAADDDDDDDGPAQARLVTRGGVPAVHLTPEWQRQSGVEVFSPAPAQHDPETVAFAEVVDLAPLLALRSRYHEANAELQIARAALASSERALERLGLLHREAGNVSARQLQEAEAQRAADHARVQAAGARLTDARYALLQAWGPVLTGWALGSGAELEPFVAGEAVLLQVALPPDRPLGAATTRIAIAPDGNRSGAGTAELVSKAPGAGGTQGETWFFRAPAAGLRTGMRLQAWIPSGGDPLAGVVLPAAAVVWHGGRAWAYRRMDGEYFSRHLLEGVHPLGGDYFVADPSLAGIEVVARGAQTLLSEEFRGGIPDEDDDP
jgi:hypothetical protein